MKKRHAEHVRKSNLRQIGFRNFEQYLRSSLWKGIQQKVLENASHKCKICGGLATTVFHRSYGIPVLKGEQLSSLMPLCQKCKDQVEFKPTGKRRLISHANKQIRKLQGRMSKKERRRINTKCGINNDGYIIRNDNLKKMGFSKYNDYLNSPGWHKIREMVLDRDHYTCICGNLAIVVHHKSYKLDVLCGKKLSGLVSLCRDCHNKIEFSEDGKTDFYRAFHKLNAYKFLLDKKNGSKRPLSKENQKLWLDAIAHHGNHLDISREQAIDILARFFGVDLKNLIS